MGDLGLVLEGGGVKGAFEAGVLKTLDDNGIRFAGVTGTSIGAVNGALYAQGGVEDVLNMWRNITTGSILNFDEEVLSQLKNHDITLDTIVYVGKKVLKLRTLLKQSGQKAEKFLRQFVDEEKLRNSGVVYGLVTYNLSNFKPIETMSEDIEEGRLVDFIVASATYPLFPPKVIEGKRYIDGGVYDNMPIGLLASRGFDRIVTVRTNLPDKRGRRADKISHDGAEVFYILPPEPLGPAMAFSSDNARRMYGLGTEAAQRALDEGLKQFIWQ